MIEQLVALDRHGEKIGDGAQIDPFGLKHDLAAVHVILSRTGNGGAPFRGEQRRVSLLQIGQDARVHRLQRSGAAQREYDVLDPDRALKPGTEGQQQVELATQFLRRPSAVLQAPRQHTRDYGRGAEGHERHGVVDRVEAQLIDRETDEEIIDERPCGAGDKPHCEPPHGTVDDDPDHEDERCRCRMRRSLRDDRSGGRERQDPGEKQQRAR